jgi:hypothetical protein
VPPTTPCPWWHVADVAVDDDETPIVAERFQLVEIAQQQV